MSLLGTPRVRIIVSDADLRRATKAIQDIVGRDARVIADKLGEIGARTLRELNEGAGHPYLARKWTWETEAMPGGAAAVIFNQAETERFLNTDAYGQPSTRWTIKGDELLRILEAGAAQHMMPSFGRSLMAFQSPAGYHRSMFRDPSYAPGKGVRAKRYLRDPDSTIYTEFVAHPGVKGNQFVKITRQILLDRMAELAKAELARTSIARV